MEQLSNDELNDLVVLCEKDFCITFNDEDGSINYYQVISWMQKEVQLLLNNDLHKLLNILYRIDISEEVTKEVLTLSTPNEMAHQLTELIVQRELQKVETRKKYRSQ